MDFLDNSENLASKVLKCWNLPLIVLLFIKSLHDWAYELNQNYPIMIIWILFQKKLVAQKFVFEAWNRVVRIDAAHDQGMSN